VKFIAYFTDEGTPSTGLSPTVTIWQVGTGIVINAAAMTEIGGGAYYYDFTTYDAEQDYFFRGDGGAGLADQDRYVGVSNVTGQLEDAIDDLTTAFQSFAGLIGTGDTVWCYTLTETGSGDPISNADVWVTSDAAGTTVLAQNKTNASGVAYFMLDAGSTAYVWRQKAGYTFANPDTEVVS